MHISAHPLLHKYSIFQSILFAERSLNHLSLQLTATHIDEDFAIKSRVSLCHITHTDTNLAGWRERDLYVQGFSAAVQDCRAHASAAENP